MNQSKIYVGNLSYNTTEDELRDLFSQYGSVAEVKLIIDFSTGRSKGFAFVSYASSQDCENAVEKVNGYQMGGRKLKVNIARDDNRRPTGGARRPNSHDRSSYRNSDDRRG
ncbi:MAG: hypothetical protein A3E82_00475 [Gammaproteobacteria bacterium RIFCSPHIGHO2_12_FULL_38_11]|nr:MAG: hypothetical protein A3E82_00475 [Gammaproteobacteria bacterium RIFCSPHIGHO2_12_FULL_38_11]